MRGVAIVAGAMLLTAVFPLHAANLTGRITVTAELRKAITEIESKKTEDERSCYWNEPNGIIAVRSVQIDPTRDIAVIIVNESGKPPGPDELATVKVHAGAMERNVVVVRPGSTLRFRNVDPFDHELYSPEMSNFKPERQSNGAFRPIEFHKEGIYEVRCKLMPHFKAYVVSTIANIVVPMRKDGTFAIKNVGEGKYFLKVFYAGKWIHKQRFEVATQRVREVKLDVKLTPKALGDEKTEKKSKTKKAASKPK